MPIKYEYDAEKNVVHCRPFGKLSVPEVGDYFNDLMTDDRIRSGFVEVIHLDKVEDYLFSAFEAREIALSFEKIRKQKDVNGSIFIGRSELHFTIARMMQLFNELNNPGHSVLIVRREDQAEKLIKEILG